MVSKTSSLTSYDPIGDTETASVTVILYVPAAAYMFVFAAVSPAATTVLFPSPQAIVSDLPAPGVIRLIVTVAPGAPVVAVRVRAGAAGADPPIDARGIPPIPCIPGPP